MQADLKTSLLMGDGIGQKPLNKQTFDTDEERVKAAKEYSKMFFGNMLKQMFKSSEKSGLWGDSHTSEMFRPLWINAIADASSGKTGFEHFIYKSIGGKNYPENGRPHYTMPNPKGGALNVRA